METALESHDPGEDALNSARKRWVYLAILLIVALGTRFYQLDVLPYGHNNDETRMAIDGYMLLEEGRFKPLIFQSRESTFPYLYGLGIEFFGFSNRVIRFPSALFGVVGAMCLCLLLFRMLPDAWAFAIGLAVVSYGSWVALDRLALRTSICTAVVFAFLLLFFTLRSSERRLHWFFLGLVFGFGFNTYNAYRAMPLVVLVLFAIHFWDAGERRYLIRKIGFFVFGALIGGANMVYIVLTEPPGKYLWREADLLGLAASGDTGFFGTVGNNFVELSTMLVGKHIPYPLGAEVPYFHVVWLPFLLFGLYAIARSKPKSPEFGLLITLLVFMLPVMLTDEFFARRFLTSLVLMIAVTGIGVYHAARWIGWNRGRWVRAGAVVLACGVASWNLWAYFVEYASMPRWDDRYGPFYSTHRFFGPIVRDHVTPETRVIFSDGIEDPWMITAHLTGVIDERFNDPEVFMRLPPDLDGGDVDELKEFCSEDVPVIFVFRKRARKSFAEDVIEICNTNKLIEADWPGNLVGDPGQRIGLAVRPMEDGGSSGTDEDPPG